MCAAARRTAGYVKTSHSPREPLTQGTKVKKLTASLRFAHNELASEFP